MTKHQSDAPNIANPYSLPLESIDPSQRVLFQHDAHWSYFDRLRTEDPVHYTPQSEFGPFWSITRYADIKYVDTHHALFSSKGGVTLGGNEADFQLPMFIAMDPPEHDEQRKVVAPVTGPRNLALLESQIRDRVVKILDSLPRGEEFNWVQHLSVELTTQMLATLFDFPFEDRYKLTHWSDVATLPPGPDGPVQTPEQRRSELLECLEYFSDLWKERARKSAPGNDLISILAQGPSTRDMKPMELLGNVLLLIVGGNDTTRNSLTGGVLALNQHPDEYQKLRDNPSHIPNMVSEVIRWQTPVAHMCRRATTDVELGGKKISKGEVVCMWFVSGNRDSEVFLNPNELRIDRPNARSHLSFGFGIHRCMGNRLGEMQVRIVWEELLKRFHKVEQTGEPTRVPSSFIRGYSELPVRVIPR
ncbi:MAG: cytochrome P450 [Gammaproteobacteria bacterium]|nr:cytochrome P450 [Gammaproteobacteria bacterium]